MSKIALLAADHPMPLCETEHGFGIQAHSYYRAAVDQMDLGLKPFQYELAMTAKQEPVDALRRYLAEHCQPGEQVELWSIWVGPPPEFGAFNRRCTLEELDLLTVYNLLKDDPICLIVTI